MEHFVYFLREMKVEATDVPFFAFNFPQTLVLKLLLNCNQITEFCLLNFLFFRKIIFHWRTYIIKFICYHNKCMVLRLHQLSGWVLGVCSETDCRHGDEGLPASPEYSGEGRSLHGCKWRSFTATCKLLVTFRNWSRWFWNYWRSAGTVQSPPFNTALEK